MSDVRERLLARPVIERKASFCERQHVCSAALERARLVASNRAKWIYQRIDHVPDKRRPTRLPLCLGDGNVTIDDFFPTATPALGASGSRQFDGLLHAVFIDDRPGPDLTAMLHIARMGNGTRMRFHALVRRPPAGLPAEAHAAWSRSTGIRFQHIDHDLLPPHVRCVHAGLGRMVSSMRLKYGTMLQPLLFWILPAEVEYALMLDMDLVPLRPFDHLLLEHAPRMRRAGALLGLAVEQSRFYTTGNAMPSGMVGFNGGVELHHIGGMRRSRAWAAALDATQAGLLFDRIGFSAEQNLYNGFAALFPHWVHPLGCEWNRQVGSWAMKSPATTPRYRLHSLATEDLELDAEVHKCVPRCAVLHFNGFKCAARLLWNTSGACPTWEALLQKVERGETAQSGSGQCPDQRSYLGMGAHELVLSNSTIALSRPGKQYHARHLPISEQGPRLAAGLRRWFGRCCTRSVVSRAER